LARGGEEGSDGPQHIGGSGGLLAWLGCWLSDDLAEGMGKDGWLGRRRSACASGLAARLARVLLWMEVEWMDGGLKNGAQRGEKLARRPCPGSQFLLTTTSEGANAMRAAKVGGKCGRRALACPSEKRTNKSWGSWGGWMRSPESSSSCDVSGRGERPPFSPFARPEVLFSHSLVTIGRVYCFTLSIFLLLSCPVSPL
jgi:hypothetical protein